MSKKKRHPLPSHHPQSSHSQTLTTQESLRVQYSAPLPPPKTLQDYNNVLPDAAERIVAMAERQSAHRQELEKKVVSSQTRDSLLGLIFGLAIGLATIAGGITCILSGYEIGGTILGGTGLGSLVAVFVYGSKQRRAEREAKWKNA